MIVSCLSDATKIEHYCASAHDVAMDLFALPPLQITIPTCARRRTNAASSQNTTTMADEMEQQLREQIASQKISLARLPTLRSIIDETGFTSPETKARARLIKELSDNEEQLELLLESERVAAVVRLQDKLHPPQNSEDCPICLETIKHVNSTTLVRFYCCGGWICRQ